MIGGLRGQVVAKSPGTVLIDVNGLIFRVLTSQNTLAEIGGQGESVQLVTHLYVREDQLTLYGFASAEELELFELLMTVTGVGPRVALSVLSVARPDAVHSAIAAEDVAMLSRVPGIGKKTAQRIIFDLRGKLPERAATAGVLGSPIDAEALEALQALGYSYGEARDALSKTKPVDGETLEERVFAALQSLARA